MARNTKNENKTTSKIGQLSLSARRMMGRMMRMVMRAMKLPATSSHGEKDHSACSWTKV
jgi:hypothetical protein